MKKITLSLLSASLVLVAATTPTLDNTEETTSKSIYMILADKQTARTAKIEAELVKKELARNEQTKLREAKIQKMDLKLQENATKRAHV
jgi:hypothetical protein